MTFHPVENVSLLYLTSSTSQITCPAFEELHSIKDALYLTPIVAKSVFASGSLFFEAEFS